MSRSAQLWTMAMLALAARLFLIVFWGIDSDEPQHLHVVWGWTAGLVQYRDLFDNHFPLLHLLFAPVMTLLPESSTVFLLARLAIAPVAIACSWLLYRIGRRVMTSHEAAFAAVLFSVMPPWLPKSVEFRNDTLWIFFWLATLAVLLAPRRARPALAGVLAGLAFLASVKAVLLLLAHALALVSERRAVPRRALVAFAAGAALPLVAACAFMQAHGALGEMLYATLAFNAALPVDTARRVVGAIAFVILGTPLALCGRRVARQASGVAAHLTLVALWFPLLLLCFWPSITPRDFLPLVPLAALAIAATPLLPAAGFVATLAITVSYARVWRPADSYRYRFVDAVTRLTAPGEFVFDLKGDAVFRPRPVRYVYEAVARALIANGTLADRGPEEIVARRCCAAIRDVDHIPSRTRAFLNAHFVSAGDLRVCGAVVRGGSFDIAVPQIYAVVADDPARVAVDGVPYRGPRFLRAGRHTIDVPPGANVRVLWWRAARQR